MVVSMEETGWGMVTQALSGATLKILEQRAVLKFDTPIELASGQMSHFFVDCKAGLSRADDLRTACRAIHAVVHAAGIEFDAVGGLTLGADHLCVGTALATGKEWFIVRKEAKKRGTARRIEGALLDGRRVLVVDDVVSTGNSLFEAIAVATDHGAIVVAACTLLDRGDLARPVIEKEMGIPYFALTSFRDFGMPPVSSKE